MFFVFVPPWVPGISLIKWPIELHMLHSMEPNHSFVSLEQHIQSKPSPIWWYKPLKSVVVYCCFNHIIYIYIYYTYIHIYILYIYLFQGPMIYVVYFLGKEKTVFPLLRVKLHLNFCKSL
jgi:hypothetical protein